jgi:plastocyanin
MKKLILISIFLVSVVGASFGTTVTITNNGFAFSPATITINVGDSVLFSLASVHNAIQVSKATWEANSATPLSGGFSLPLGGGKVGFSVADTIYYVCGPHVASFQMKGVIIVKSNVTDVSILNSNIQEVNVFPDPAIDFITVSYTLPSASTVNIRIINSVGLEVKNILYESQSAGKYQETITLNNQFTRGVYFILMNSNNQSYIQKLIVK